jgi:protein SCO1
MVIHTSKHVLFLIVIATNCALLAGCHRPSTARYPFKGRLVSIDTAAHTALIDADAIPGFMEAMAMSYKFQPSSILSQLAANDTISADVVVVRSGGGDDAATDYWLENVKVTGHAKEPPAKLASSVHLPQVGESVPDFAFTNQSGKRVSIGQYQGKVLLMTFIYTRCPFPDFCPRMSSNFAEIYKQLDSNPALAKTQLLSISFDPQHDTPKVLRNYGFSVAHTHDPELFNRWQFAAPKATDLPKIADFFALTVKPEGGMITHNLSTVVVGPDGKIVKWYHGSDWQVSDLIKDAGEAAAPKT